MYRIYALVEFGMCMLIIYRNDLHTAMILEPIYFFIMIYLGIYWYE